jgi:DNA-binding beta-propeller fold protein YncE
MPAEVPNLMADFFVPRSTDDESQASHEATHSASRLCSSVVRRGPVGDIAVTDHSVVVTNYGDDTVALLDPNSLEIAGVIAVPGEPVAVTVHEDRAYVSTSSTNHDAVSVLDLTSQAVLGSYAMAFSVTALAISPDGKRVYVGRTADDHIDVAVIDTTAERVGTIDIASGAGISLDALRVDPSGKRLYVGTTDVRGSALVTVDLERAVVGRVIEVGSPIRDVAFADGTAFVLTSDRVNCGTVQVVDLAAGAVTRTVPLGMGAPTQMAMSSDGTRLYVIDYDRVAVVCALTHEVVDTLTVDARPSCAALDDTGSRLYVADYEGRVTAFAVDSNMSQLYSQFVATDPIAMALPALQPAGA